MVFTEIGFIAGVFIAQIAASVKEAIKSLKEQQLGLDKLWCGDMYNKKLE